MIVNAGDYLYIPRGSSDHTYEFGKKSIQKVRVYEIKTTSKWDYMKEKVNTRTIIKVIQDGAGQRYYSAWFSSDSIGKSIFTTEEEAQKKLERMK